MLVLLVASCGGGDAAEPEPEPTTTIGSRSNNEVACRHLRTISDINEDTARLSRQVATLVVGGAADDVLAAAAGDLAAHLEAAEPDLGPAYQEAAKVAPAAVAGALDELAAAAAETTPGLIEVLRSAGAQGIRDLYGTIGNLGADAFDPDADPGAVDEIRRYTDVICGFDFAG